MAKFELKNNVTRSLYKLGFKLKQHSPEILVAAGTVGVVASTIMACKATTKINFVLEETKNHLDVIHAGVENGEIKAEVDGEVQMIPYSEEDGKKDTAIVYAQTGLKLAKLYGPAIALGVASLGCMLASHRIMHKRNIALAAAYTAVDRGFKEYRGRVIERFGNELDRELKYNIKAKEIEEIVVDEDGSQHTVKKTVQVADVDQPSEWARFFDDGCRGWDKNPEFSLMFLLKQQEFATERLKARGWLTINEVYEALGIPRTEGGQVVGWYYDESDPLRDNVVDFGIYDMYSAKKRDFVNGYEKVILLDFNVDGYIAHLIR